MNVLTSLKDVQKVSEKVRDVYCIMIFFYIVRGVVRGIIKGVGNQEPLVFINFVVYLLIFPLTVHAARNHDYFSHTKGIWILWVARLLSEVIIAICYNIVVYYFTDFKKAVRWAQKRKSLDAKTRERQ